MTTRRGESFAAWQRPPRPVRKVLCCACLQDVRLTDTWPLAGERVCKDCTTVDDRRIHRLESQEPNR